MANVESRISNSLKKYRRIMGYSQKEVAKILGFKSASRISRWERGFAMPGVENLLKLSFLYGTLPAELYADMWNEVREELRDKKLTAIR